MNHPERFIQQTSSYKQRPLVKIQKLNEEYHVFQKENPNYLTNITKILDKCVTLLRTKQNLIKLYNDQNILYAKYITSGSTFNFGNINHIQIYVGIDYTLNPAGSDDVTIAVQVDESDYDPNEHPLFNKFKHKIDYATIIITGGNTLANRVLYKKYITDLSHELLHVFHALKQSELNARAGDAYYNANSILEIIEAPFPDKEVLQEFSEFPVLYNHELLIVFCACMYYLDNSEYSAWLDSFYTELIYKHQVYPLLNKSIIAKHTSSYVIFNSLHQLLTTYIDDFINIPNIIKNDKINSILTSHFKKHVKQGQTFKNLNLTKWIKWWIYRCETFLDKCNKITITL